MKQHEKEYYEGLLMKAVDGVLEPQERDELEAFLKREPGYKEELDDFLAIKHSTDTLRERILADARIEPPRPGKGSEAFHGLMILLILGGISVLFGFQLYHVFLDPSIPLLLKAGGGLIGLGMLGLFGRVLLLRLRSLPHDPYKEIDQ